MAMNIGEKREGAMAEMNVVPLIDVLLVLLIIFMVIAPVNPAGLRAAVPQPAGPADDVAALSPVVVQVTADGAVKVNQQDVDWSSLGARLNTIFERRAQKTAFIQGESMAEFSDVARALNVMYAAGIEDVGLLPGAPAGKTN